MSHYALVTDDRGNLAIRRFASAADAAKVSAARELHSPAPVPGAGATRRTSVLPAVRTERTVEEIMGPKGGQIRHTQFARRLGLHPRTVKRLWLRGGLPGAKQHSVNILMVPLQLLRLAETFGLRRVEMMAKAGEL